MIVVPERSYQVHFLWGFLTIVSAIVLGRAAMGMSGTGRIVTVSIVGAFVLIFLSAWIWFARHPATLEVTPEEIRFQHLGQKGFTALPHTGALYVKRTLMGGKHPLAYLRVEGSDAAIAMGGFDLARIKEAAAETGWEFKGI